MLLCGDQSEQEIESELLLLKDKIAHDERTRRNVSKANISTHMSYESVCKCDSSVHIILNIYSPAAHTTIQKSI